MKVTKESFVELHEQTLGFIDSADVEIVSDIVSPLGVLGYSREIILLTNDAVHFFGQYIFSKNESRSEVAQFVVKKEQILSVAEHIKGDQS